MKKKIIYIIIIIIVIFIYRFSLYTKGEKDRYLDSKLDSKTTTTGVKSKPFSDELLTEAKTINKLKNELPFKTDLFVIADFDYKNGLFIVDFDNKSVVSIQNFNDWLLESEFSSIPKTKFKFN